MYAGGALSRIVTTSTRQQRRLHHQRSSGCTAEQRLRPGRRPPTAAGMRPGRCGGDKAFDPHIDSFSDIY